VGVLMCVESSIRQIVDVVIDEDKVTNSAIVLDR
jgi:hypothetical protein